MKIVDILSIINKEKTVLTSRVMSVKKKYLGLYKASLMELYDKGYVCDPTVFCEKEIYQNIIELDIIGMVDSSGKIVLTEQQVNYAICRNKNAYEEVTDFLRILKEVLKYKKLSDDIDFFYEECCLHNCKKTKVGLKMFQTGSRFYTKSFFPISESVLECFLDFGYEAEFVDLREEFWKMGIEELGISVKESRSDGLFCKGFTHEEELSNLELIFEGMVRLDGTRGDVLFNWLKGHKWATNIAEKYKSKKSGLYNFLLLNKVTEVGNTQISLIEKVLGDKEEGEEEIEILALDTYGVYYKKKPDTIKIIGSPLYVMCSYDDELGIDRNIFEGFIGEAYPVEYLENENINFVGCPIELFVDIREKQCFIDVEQTSLKDTQVSWFKHNNCSIVFEGRESGKSLFEEGSIESILYKLYIDMESGIFITEIPNIYTEAEIEKAKKTVVVKAV